MHVTKLQLSSWGPYRGDHELELSPTVYGVLAKHDRDQRRSNWLGKSWLLGAVRFALFGVSPAQARVEDDWITRSEGEGAVALELSTGERIERRRQRGKPTQVRLQPRGAVQAAASAEIERLVGMGRADFDVGPWVGQKAASGLVEMDGAPRHRLVDGWLGLQPLRDAEQVARDRAAELASRAEVARSRAEGALAQPEPTADLGALRREQQAAEQALEAAELAVRWWEAEQGASRYVEIVARGTALKARLESLRSQLPDLGRLRVAETKARKAALAVDKRRLRASDDLAVAGKLLGKRFDGECPVMGSACPVAPDVEEGRLRRRAEYDGAKAAFARLEAEFEQAQRLLDEAYAAVRDAERTQQQLHADEQLLQQLREQLALVQADADYTEQHPEPELSRAQASEQRTSAQSALNEARSELARAQAQQQAYEAAKQHAERHRADAAELEQAATVWAAAARVLRQARREVAQRAVCGIECGANRLIATSGIDLHVALSWEREGGKLAGSCEGCGRAYRGQRDKSCPDCGRQRGKQLIEQLEPVLSNRSGAADDVAGLALQLAAAAWLRAKRQSEWGVLLVDEPFGSLDEAHRGALASHLRAMLDRGNSGFEQAFVVAHDARVMEGLPARIVIRSDGQHARLELE